MLVCAFLMIMWLIKEPKLYFTWFLMILFLACFFVFGTMCFQIAPSWGQLFGWWFFLLLGDSLRNVTCQTSLIGALKAEQREQASRA